MLGSSYSPDPSLPSLAPPTQDGSGNQTDYVWDKEKTKTSRIEGPPPPPRSICRTAGTTHLASFTPNKMSAEMQIDFACLWKIRIDLLDYFIPKAHACAYVPLIPTTRVPLITSFQPPLGKMHQRWKSFSTYHRF